MCMFHSLLKEPYSPPLLLNLLSFSYQKTLSLVVQGMNFKVLDPRERAGQTHAYLC